MEMQNVETTQGQATLERERRLSSLGRVLKYTLVRGGTLLVTVVIGVYLAILIANGGGYVDEMRIGTIRETISLEMGMDPEMQFLTHQERRELEDARVQIQVE